VKQRLINSISYLVGFKGKLVALTKVCGPS